MGTKLLLAILIFGGLSITGIFVCWPILSGKLDTEPATAADVETDIEAPKDNSFQAILIGGLVIAMIIIGIFIFVPYKYIREAFFIASVLIALFQFRGDGVIVRRLKKWFKRNQGTDEEEN